MINNYIKLSASTWCGEITKGLDPRRKEFIIRKANIAMQMDHWDYMDGKPIGTTGDKIFQPKNEIERILWQDVRNNAKTDMGYMIRQRNNGSMGGRPKKEPEPDTKPKTAMETFKDIPIHKDITECPNPMNAEKKRIAAQALMDTLAHTFKAPPMYATTIGKTPIPPAMQQFLETEFTPAENTKLNRWLTENKTGEIMKNESILKAACTIAKKNYADVSARFLRFQLK